MKRWMLGLIAIALLHDVLPHILHAQRDVASADLYFPPELTPHVEEVVARPNVRITTIPLLPMIFFDEPGGTTIPARYQSDLEVYPCRIGKEEVLEHGMVIDLEHPETALDPYYEILKILALRLARYEEATITLMGRYSDEPGEGPEIGLQRAMSVRDRMTMSGGVDPDRILIAPPQLLLPESEGLISDPADFREEGRRVDIASSTPEVFDDIFVYLSSINAETFSSTFHLTHHVDSTEILSVDFDSYLDGEQLGRTTWHPTEEQGVYRFQGDWMVSGKSLTRYPGFLIVRATVRLKDNSTRVSDPMMIPITYRKFRSSSFDCDFHIPRDRRPAYSDDHLLGTFFFEEGGRSVPSTAGVGIRDAMKRTPRGMLNILIYHPVDSEEQAYEPVRNEEESVRIVEEVGSESESWICGFGMSIPTFPVYAGGLIGYSEEGKNPEESKLSSDDSYLVRERTRAIRDTITDLLSEEKRLKDSTVIRLNPRHLGSIQPIVQRRQSMYPTTLPEGRFYRRAVRLALQFGN